ncbi:hypothetical protein KTC92_16680 [Clostridium sp. CM027]|nr:hypothetical protein [Clostridium sp. CM027]UVE42768.1 hypothetical protein KTC92_16680 [Clostridium sp. CM027]
MSRELQCQLGDLLEYKE